MKKSAKKVPQKTKKIQIPYIKIIYISLSLILVFGFLFIFDRPVMRQAVQGMSIVRSLYVQSSVALPSVNGAVAYNVYYKSATDKTFTHSVRKIPATIRFYAISYLKRGESYEYQISAVNYQGREFWFSPVEKVTNVTPM